MYLLLNKKQALYRKSSRIEVHTRFFSVSTQIQLFKKTIVCECNYYSTLKKQGLTLFNVTGKTSYKHISYGKINYFVN
jgi:hypothetical protein